MVWLFTLAWQAEPGQLGKDPNAISVEMSALSKLRWSWLVGVVELEEGSGCDSTDCQSADWWDPIAETHHTPSSIVS